MRRLPLENLGNAFLKRAADILLSVMILIAFSPLMLIIAIGVGSTAEMTSSGFFSSRTASRRS